MFLAAQHNPTPCGLQVGKNQHGISAHQ